MASRLKRSRSQISTSPCRSSEIGRVKSSMETMDLPWTIEVALEISCLLLLRLLPLCGALILVGRSGHRLLRHRLLVLVHRLLEARLLVRRDEAEDAPKLEVEEPVDAGQQCRYDPRLAEGPGQSARKEKQGRLAAVRGEPVEVLLRPPRDGSDAELDA